MTGTEPGEAADRPVALVTGGSRGIGRAVVTRLAEDGWDVAFCYKSSVEAANEVAKVAGEAGARVLASEVDVADATQARDFVKSAERELGRLSAVVTSAGVIRDTPLALMADDQWHDVLRTNLDGTFNICRAAVYSMLKRRTGSIVTLSSVAGRYGSAGQTNYSASKAGIIGFTKALAKECGPRGVRANVVAPGFIETDMTAGVADDAKQRYLDAVPLGRFGAADEVADVVSFLVSDRAAYVTGQVLGVDGGLVF